MAILIVLIAYYCVKNTTQDLIYAITGRVPPSFVREQQRMQLAREAIAAKKTGGSTRRPISGNRGHQKFFRNAYNDAWETAEERRARWAQKRAQKRRGRWEAEDGIPAPVSTNATPEDNAAAGSAPPARPSQAPARPAQAAPAASTTATSAATLDSREEALYRRYALRRRNGGQPLTDLALADDIGTDIPTARAARIRWDARYSRDTGDPVPTAQQMEYARRLKCADCGGGATGPYRDKGEWRIDLLHDGDCVHAPPPSADRSATPPERDEDSAAPASTASNGDAAVDDLRRDTEAARADRQAREKSLDEWREYCAMSQEEKDGLADQQRARMAEMDRKYEAAAQSGSSTTEGNSDMANAETTGLQSGIAYNDEMATKCAEGATSVETSVSALQSGEVGASVTDPMTQAREHLDAAAALFQQASGELQSHLGVKERYDATPDAGNKQFVTSE